MRIPSAVLVRNTCTATATNCEQHERDRDAEDRFVGNHDQRFGKSRQSAPAGEIDADPVKQRHGAEGHQDRVDADNGDQQAGDQADDRAQYQARNEGEEQPPGELRPDRFGRHHRDQDPGHQQSRQVGGGDDGEIDAAGDQRDRHRQRQQAQLWHLEHHRLQRRPARECRRLDQREKDHQQRKQGKQAAETDRAAAHPADQPIGVAGEESPLVVGNRMFHQPARAMWGRRDRFSA